MFKLNRIVMLSLALALVAAAFLAASTLTSSDAEAARGGKGGKNGGTTSTATLTVSPNPVPLNSTSISISGSGFAANQLVYLDVSGWIPFASVTTDGSGSFSTVYSHLFWGEGQYYVRAYVGETIVTQVNFTVCSTNPC